MTYAQLYKELERKVQRDYGNKCKEIAWGCIVCQAWIAVDFLATARTCERELKKK